MRTSSKFYNVLEHLQIGKIYHWHELRKLSKSLGRDISNLLKLNLLEKVGPGLYYRPQKSRFGELPPDDDALIKAFLKSNDYLLFSDNLYNSLGLGLTQLKNTINVYNKKRYETITLAGREFHFKRPNNEYPKKLTPEFLLVDLVNNIKNTGENPENLKNKIQLQLREGKFDMNLLKRLASKHGKVGTRKIFTTMMLPK